MSLNTRLLSRGSARVLTLALAISLALGGLGVFSTTFAADEDISHSTLAQEGDAARPWLGVAVSDFGPRGARIGAIVAGSPAEEAGLMLGMLITAVDDQAINNAEELVSTVGAYAPGDAISLTANGQDYAITLATLPADLEVGAVVSVLGIESELQEDGLLVNTLEDDSPLAEAGVEVGDVITAMNGEALPGGLTQLVMNGQTVELSVTRGDEELTVSLWLPMTEMIGMMDDEFMPGFDGMGSGPMMGANPPSQLGVEFRTITPELAAEEELAAQEGALLVQVFEDTPAAEAGLMAGDILTAVDGDTIDQERTLTDRLYAYEEGDVVTFDLLREGETLSVEVTLGPSRGALIMPGGPGMFQGEMMPEGVFTFGDGFLLFCFADQDMMPENMPDEMGPGAMMGEGFFCVPLESGMMPGLRGERGGQGFHFFGPRGGMDDARPYEGFMEDHPFLQDLDRDALDALRGKEAPGDFDFEDFFGEGFDYDFDHDFDGDGVPDYDFGPAMQSDSA